MPITSHQATVLRTLINNCVAAFAVMSQAYRDSENVVEAEQDAAEAKAALDKYIDGLGEKK